MKYLFFYSSEKCENSVHMCKILTREKILPMFEQYDINKLSAEQLIQFGLQKVPAFIIVNRNGQSSIKEGKDAFSWIEQLVLNRRQQMAMMANANRLRIMERNMQLNKDNSVADYCNEEMSGLSDGYAYLLTDLPQSKNYVGLGLKDQTIVTIQEQGSLKKNDTDNAIKNVEAMRKKQEEMLGKEMKEGQLMAIYNNRYGGK